MSSFKDKVVLVTGAGAILPLADASFAHINEIFAINVIGPSLLATAALPHLKRAADNIVNLSST